MDINYEKNNLYSIIIITDSGKGINKKDLPHIFERFYKGQNSSKDSNGIGLALSKAIIEKRKGSVTVESTIIIKYF